MTELDLLYRGFEEIIPEDEFEERMSDTARVKFGADPTGSDLHLGHAVILNKLRQFQDAGHTVVFIIGDYTGRIGDPSGRDETRPTLSKETVEQHAETYKDQVFEILDRDSTEVRYNSEWLQQLGSDGLLELASGCTVARMLERDDFSTRFEQNSPIRIHEFLYPLLQAYDSVAVQSDLELGGTDQKFNLLMGRELQKDEGQAPQLVGTLPLLVGTDGSKKMSKSYGNHIPLQSTPQDMFGQLMSLPDHLIVPYMELLTGVSNDRIEEIQTELNQVDNPKSLKKDMAFAVTRRFKGETAASEAQDHFERTIEQGEDPQDDEVPSVTISERDVWIVDLLDESGMVDSRSDAKRLLNQGGVYLDGEQLEGMDYDIPMQEPHLLRVGKHNHRRMVPN